MAQNLSEHCPVSPPLQHRWLEAALRLFIVLFILLFAAVASKIHDILGTSAYDMGVFGQAFWLESRFLHNFNTIRGVHTLGDHLGLINSLFLPFNVIYFSVHWSLVGQAISVGVGAYFCHKIARHFLPSHPILSIALALSYLLHPLVHNTLLWQYHEVVMASGIYMFFIYSYLKQNFTSFALSAILLLLCREDMSLTLLAFVALPLWQRRWSYALFLVVTASAYWWFSFKVALPFYNGVGYFRDVYGPVASAKFNLTHPDILLARLMSFDARFYIYLIFAPLACLSIAAPLYLMAALPALLFNIVVGGYYDQPFFHYSVNVMPFVYLAAITALSRFVAILPPGRVWPEWVGSGLILGLVLFFYSQYSVMNLAQMPIHWQEWQNLAPLREELHRIDQQIGAEGNLAASDFLLPQMVKRKEVYLFPNPWKVHYWGINGESPRHPNRVEWILVAPDFRTEHQKDLLDYLTENGYFTLVQSHEKFLLFHRQKPEKESRDEAIAAFLAYRP